MDESAKLPICSPPPLIKTDITRRSIITGLPGEAVGYAGQPMLNLLYGITSGWVMQMNSSRNIAPKEQAIHIFLVFIDAHARPNVRRQEIGWITDLPERRQSEC